jgi:glycylpeptide N-tetradecanoyltransferase
MTALDKGKSTVPKIINTNAEPEWSGDDSEPEALLAEEGAASPDSGSTSHKKKKKKKSKVKKLLDALGGKNQIPQELVDRVLEKVKEENVPGSADLNTENVRQALQEMKIMDVVRGKAGIGGINKKAMGEHKVCFPAH